MPFCQIFSKNGFSSTKKAVPPEELEPELFLKESKPCQTDPLSMGGTAIREESEEDLQDPHGNDLAVPSRVPYI